MAQLGIVMLIQFTEPLSAEVIYPFVNQFVRRTGITNHDEKRTGYYAGIIESVFFIAEAATALSWQIAADRFGRRPILLVAPLGLAFSMFLFGSAKVFLTLVIARCLQGIFNGNLGVAKTVMGELTDSTNRAEAMSLVPVLWSVGVCLAPFIGGVFSTPEDHFPGTFGRIQYLRDNPYFLPCAIVGCLSLLSFLVALMNLKETSPTILKANRKKQLATETQPLLDGPLDLEETTSPLIKNLLTRPVLLVLGTYMVFAFVEMCTYALIPLVWSTSIGNGGLGLTAYNIGLINAGFGIPNAVFQIKYLSRILRWVGPKRLTVGGFVGIFLCNVLFPIENHLARASGEADWRVGVAILAHLLCLSTLYGGYASLAVYLLEISPSPEALGTIQGLAQTLAVICRACGPATATSLFALSTERNLLNGYFVYIVLGIVNVAAIYISCLLPNLDVP
ncbi:major facilitator superfamily domain-containing protein [Flagelloscypha sp. PMI_526]|nr:major facilitator superfamily domain-containing protein [Flagelloscypha sp. PMI_526]